MVDSLEGITVSTSDLAYYSPAELLYLANPEIATLALAHKDGWISPEILPAMNTFRVCQAEERIARTQAIVDTLAIGADERKNQVVARTRESLGRMKKEGIIIKEAGATERVQIEMQGRLDSQKLLYESNYRLLEKEGQTRRYLSDNEFKATQIQTDALQRVILFKAGLQAASRDKATAANLVARMQEANVWYLAKVKEAEAMVLATKYRGNAAVMQSYLKSQAAIIHHALQLEAARVHVEGEIAKASYGAVAEIAKAALQANPGKSFEFKGKTEHGSLSFEMRQGEEGK